MGGGFEAFILKPGIIWQSVLLQSFLSGGEGSAAATGVIQRAKVVREGKVNLRAKVIGRS